MLYIHKLSNLAPKTADVESVYLIRELKQKTPYPLTEQAVSDYFSELMLSTTDKEQIEHALSLVQPTIEEFQQLLLEKDAVLETINIQRAIQVLQEMPEALRANLNYLMEMMHWQRTFAFTFVPLFNSIPKLKTDEEKVNCNQKVNALFQKVLRNEQFAFSHSDLVHEAHVSQMAGLQEGLGKGFLFNITLEEELKKISYETLRARLPQERLRQADHLANNVEIIKRGIERSYQANMNMVNWALVMYAYMKWITGK